MGFKLEFIPKADILVVLPEENRKEAWELTKKIIDIYFEEPEQKSRPYEEIAKECGLREKKGGS